ncbi:MAG TPA: nickel insertion protein [Prolixibacteraceae bacterium]|nr:nickel insertion protein [Prolixibacteraceae bacterium]
MKCEDVKFELPEYIDGKLDEKTTGAVRSHLEICDDCRKLYSEMNSFLTFTASFPEEKAPEGMKDEFMKLFEEEMPQKQRKMVMVPAWMKVAAMIVVALVTYSTGYYMGTEKGEEKTQQLEVALNQTRQQVLLAGLKEYTGPQKIQAVYNISQSGLSGDALVDALVNTMNSDRNVNVRLAAINALSGMMKDNEKVKKELIRSLSLQDNALLQISLIQVLTESGVKEAKAEIESIVENEKTDENVKAYAKDMIKIII